MSSKKHHFVPRSWLKHFSVDQRGKQVCVFDKKRGSSHCSSIADAGSENHFNTVEIGGRRVVFEGLFQECDDRLAPIIGSLIRHERLSALSDEDRVTLAHIAVIQLFRVNMQRTTIVEMARNLRRMLREHGRPELVDPSPAAEENEARQMALDLLRDATKFVPHFLEKNWCLFRAPDDAPFWISDNPVLRQSVYPYGDAGLGSPGVEIIMPLGSTLLLSLACPSVAVKYEAASPEIARVLRLNPTFHCKAEGVRYYNSLQVHHSSRFLYGPTRDFDMARSALQKHPEAREVKSLMSMSGLGEAPKKDSMPDGAWLGAYGVRSHHMLRVLDWRNHSGGLRVRLQEQDAPALRSLVADGPFALVEVYSERSAVRGMRNVRAEGDGSEAGWIELRHADPSLHELMRKLDGGRVGDS
ncbi:MAG: DUF4238 domain-containing protein [Planctomycetota bacterium]